MARIAGVLSVKDNVILRVDTGEIYQILSLPMQSSVSWEQMVAHSVDFFREMDGCTVTLEGNLQGNILAAAHQVVAISPRQGTYHGRVESASGVQLRVELRIDKESRVISADYFLNGNFYCSMRARVAISSEILIAESPRFIFNSQSESNIGGRIELTTLSQQTIGIKCILPEAFPDEYNGELTSASDYYRTLNIEVDKLDGLPWPPEYSTRDIPHGHQPMTLENESINLSTLFQKAGIDARVHYNDGALDAAIVQLAGRPGEEDRWDEREMHEMMDTNYSRNLSVSEWWLYLLIVTRFDGGPSYDYQTGKYTFDDDGNIVNDGKGTTGIIFDHNTGSIQDPWIGFYNWYQEHDPQFCHLFDFGRSGSFANSRARQGVAVFWREMLDWVDLEETWYKHRQFLRTIVHELGHALNLAHTWLVGRPDTTSFMMYPQRYPHGSSYSERTQNYWRDFDYAFDPEEVFHFRHGFYHEIIPGGKLEFMEWTPSSVFHDPAAGGTRANISMELAPTKSEFLFTEPVTLEITIRNHTAEDVPIGRLSPSYGDTKFVIKKPNGAIEGYKPPLIKCETSKQSVGEKGLKTHLTSLSVGNKGFVFDSPGRYEITASIADPSTGALVIARPISIWVRYPMKDDESIANRIFDRQAAMFLYMGGGNHLDKGKIALEDTADRFPEHPFSAHANLVLGLNELSGQKSIVKSQVKRSKPGDALPFLEKAFNSQDISASMKKRLQSTLANIEVEKKRPTPRKRQRK